VTSSLLPAGESEDHLEDWKTAETVSSTPIDLLLAVSLLSVL